MRVLTACLAIALAACTAAPVVVQSTPVPTHEPNTVNVSVLLDLSGQRAPRGQPQRDAMQLWLDQAQSAAVIKLRVKFVDVAGSDARLLLELRRAAVDDQADAIVVGVPVTLDGSFGDAVQLASIPVLLTPPVAEPMTGPAGRFAFALAPTTESVARALASDMIDRGTAAPTLLADDESPAAVVERIALVAELKSRGVTPPSALSLAQPDAAQRVAAWGAAARRVVFAGATAPYGDAIRAIPAISDAPPVYLSYLTETADLVNLREQAPILIWPGSRSLASLSVSLFPTQRSVVQAFTDRHGAPSTLAMSAYDALGLIEIAARQAPTELDAARLRLRLETTTFLGVVTRYSFSPQRHAGFTPDDLALLRWNAPRGAPFLAPK